MTTNNSNHSSGLASVRNKLRIAFTHIKAWFFNLLDLTYFEKFVPESFYQQSPEYKRKRTLPIFIILLGFILIYLLGFFSPTASKKKDVIFTPTVKIVTAIKQDLQIPVTSQGVITPKNESRLVSLANGQVIYVSPNFNDGSLVKKDELLVRISDRAYQQDKARAEANLARAESAQFAKQSELRVQGTLRSAAGKAQYREVNAALKAAQADLQRVNDLIASTKIKAPFTGIVRGANVSQGQALQVGYRIASIFTTESSLLNLPLSDRQLALVKIPKISSEQLIKDSPQNEVGEDEKGNNAVKNKEIIETIVYPKVKLKAEFGANEFTWEGRLIRSAGARNEKNRLQYVVVEIATPYADDPEQNGRPPLAPGFFVQAEIDGKLIKDLIRLPRKALKSNQKLWAINSDNRLEKLTPNILYKGKDYIYISSGVENGMQIVISDLDLMAPGIKVKVINSDNLETFQVKDIKTDNPPQEKKEVLLKEE